MKKVAVTVAVLALGLAGCAQDNEANELAANDVYAENEAGVDMNASMNEIAPEEAAQNALENATQSIENAQEAVENVGDTATNTQ